MCVWVWVCVCVCVFVCVRVCVPAVAVLNQRTWIMDVLSYPHLLTLVCSASSRGSGISLGPSMHLSLTPH